MPVIDNTHVAYNENSETFWQSCLQNARIVLYEVENGILTLISSGHASYELNTGQSSQSVRRLSLQELKELKIELLSQIDDLEKMLGIRSSRIQIIPGF